MLKTKFTNIDIIETAMKQSSIDSNCRLIDFTLDENVVVHSKPSIKARQYLKLPFLCDLTSYGSNIVASVSPEYERMVSDFISKHEFYHCFETPNLYKLNEAFAPFNAKVCFMAEYFLPDINVLEEKECGYELRVLKPKDLAEFYKPEWSNALSLHNPKLDQIAVGAFDGTKLVGLAAASKDCETMWQIGVDVLPEYRRHGIASAVTSKLAIEILNRGIVPFYCCAWSNLRSVRNAFSSGFKPGWVQVTVKDNDFIDELNRQKPSRKPK